MSGDEPGDWDAVFKPRVMSTTACIVAAVIAVAGLVVAVLNDRASGAYLRTADQIAMGALALIIAGAVLLLTRPRVKAGKSGLAVRNILGYRLIPWPEVIGVGFPPGKRWARVELDYDEYVPAVAIQSVDGEQAVVAMETIRNLMDRYASRKS